MTNIFSDTLIVDTSYWRLDDKKFQDERKKKWPAIEKVLSHWSKSKKAIYIIKKYYLKGETPVWRKVATESEPGNTFLDIATFLWLHPSSDPAVLIPLRDAYFQGFGRKPYDVTAGMSFIFRLGVINAALNGEDWPSESSMILDGKEKLLFDLIFGTVKDGVFEFGGSNNHYEYFWRGESCIHYIADWLILKTLNDCGKTMILQFDEPLYIMFDSINRARFSDAELRREFYATWLYRIAFFDTEKEGDSPRTTCVIKVRKILDSGSNTTELTELWRQVKNGEITVKKPWKL